jgi:hypothetical protein
MFEDTRVGGGQAPAADLRVGHQQTIEGIARPPDLGGAQEPRPRRRFVHQPPVVMHHPLNRVVPQAHLPGFVQKLQFEDGCGGDVQPIAAVEQRTRPACPASTQIRALVSSRITPGACPGILSPLDVKSQVHCPSATAGSRMSRCGVLAFRADAGLSTESRERIDRTYSVAQRNVLR